MWYSSWTAHNTLKTKVFHVPNQNVAIATSWIDIPILTEAKKGNNYRPIKEDETYGDKKKHLTYLDGKKVGQ